MNRQRYKQIQRVQLILIFLNFAVSASKLICGLAYGLVSMSADGIHSLTDGLNNVVGMVGIYFAYQPNDKKHPYGHRKFETMTTLAISVLLFSSTLNLLKGAYDRLIEPVRPEVTSISFIVMIFTIAVNIIVNVYEKKKGKELQSDFLISDAAHTLSDVFVSISVIGTLIAVKLGYIWVDTVVSVAIALMICRAGIQILKRGTDTLCDAVVIDPEKISAIACGFSEVISCHAVRSHGLADDAHVDLHISVHGSDMTFNEVHSLIHRIGDTIKASLPGVAEVLIHVDPPDDEC